MRPKNTASPMKPARRPLATTAAAGTPAEFDLWRAQALRDAAAVRRVLRGVRTTGAGAVGIANILRALAARNVDELLLTRRFLELRPEVSAQILMLARASDVDVTIASGAAAFELDLAAGGLGALLRRSPRHHIVVPSVA